MSSVIEQVTNLVSPILAERHFELVDLEFVKEGKSWYLRVFIDKVGGINIEECALISDLLSEKLDAQDPDLIPQAYYLEVSSPGAERPLKNDRDLQRSLNKYVNVSLYQALNGQKVYEGDLVEITADDLVLAVIQKQRQLKLKIPRQQIAKIRLAIKF